MRIILETLREMGTTARWRHGILPLLLIAGMQSQPLLAQETETLVKIEVIGANKQSPETVIYRSGLSTGDDLRQVNMTDVMERLWKSGAFDDIKLDVEDVDGGKKLIIRVVERPIIKSVDYRGGSDIGLSSLKDRIKELKLEILPDSIYDPEQIRKVQNVIVDRCAEKGYQNPIINIDLEPVSPGVSRLIFDINEGGKARIIDIEFKGNTVISSSKLAGVMKKSGQHWLLSWLTGHDIVVDKNLEEDVENIKKAYWRIGYKDVFVGKPIVSIDDQTTPLQKQKNEERTESGKSPRYDIRATVVFRIIEGEQYFEGITKIEGNDKVFKGKKGETELLLKIAEARQDHLSKFGKFFAIKPTAKELTSNKLRPFDMEALDEGIEKMRDEYANKSYVMFKTEKQLSVRQEGGIKKVDTTIKIDEGDPYTIHRIEIGGNNLTKDKVIRRALLLRDGDPFRVDLLKDSYTSVGQLGYFDIRNEEPKIDFVKDKPEVNITLNGHEAGTNEITFQGGYGSVMGFNLGAGYSTRNLGGGGESLSVNYNIGKYQRNASISYLEPYIFDLPYSFSARVFDSYANYDASRVGIENAYTQKTRGFGFAVGSRLSNFWSNGLWAHYTTLTIGYNASWAHYNGTDFLYKDVPYLRTSSISPSIVYDTTDHPFKPTRGVRLGFSYEFAPGFLGTNRPYNKVSSNAAGFYTPSDRHTFAANINYGYIKNESSDGIPLISYYRLGGEESVRGYEYGQIGSIRYDNLGNAVVVGGNKQLVVNLEYQFKIAEDMRLVFFYDAGNAWAPGVPMFSRQTVNYRNFLQGVDVTYQNPTMLQSMGLEFRLFLPWLSQAPMRFIWADKRNPYAFDTRGKSSFQFSIGTTF
jgi:outer membrane protein insertion porin family